jgi:basic amino acid/polyamine antiporter, APA family
VMLTFLLGVTRVWFSMSRDGLLPPGSPRSTGTEPPNG